MRTRKLTSASACGALRVKPSSPLHVGTSQELRHLHGAAVTRRALIACSAARDCDIALSARPSHLNSLLTLASSGLLRCVLKVMTVMTVMTFYILHKSMKASAGVRHTVMLARLLPLRERRAPPPQTLRRPPRMRQMRAGQLAQRPLPVHPPRCAAALRPGRRWHPPPLPA